MMDFDFEFDIEEVKEKIQNLSHAEKIAYLTELEDEFDNLMEELDGYSLEISDLKDEENEHYEQIIQDEATKALADVGYNLSFSNGTLKMPLGDTTASVSIALLEDIITVNVYLMSEKHQIPYQNLVAMLLPTFKHEGNNFSCKCLREEVCDCVVKAVSALLSGKKQFEDIG